MAIETPEHIVFRHKLAGPSRRFLAYLLDLVICYTAFTVIAFIVVLVSIGAAAATDATESALGAGIGLLLVVLFAIQWVYFAVLEAWRGRTPGKAALGLRVVSTSGRPIGFRAAALRNVLRAADALPLTYTAGLLSLAGLVS
ncbi:MAG: RDD family protein, partial [Polyangiaceae bacterium]